jgi:hypothetical protein
MLDEKLNGFGFRYSSKKITVIAYTDDVTVFVKSPADIQLIQEAITCYQAASGAQLNIEKSKAMAIGSWDTSSDIMGIQYHTAMKILGVQMHNSLTIRE